MTALNPALQVACDALSRGVAEYTGEDLKFEITAVAANFDELTRKYPLGRFSIQRRENAAFSENKYFSEAPLQTAQHISLLEQFEAALIA